jgi:flagellar assembly protein FliH
MVAERVSREETGFRRLFGGRPEQPGIDLGGLMLIRASFRACLPHQAPTEAVAEAQAPPEPEEAAPNEVDANVIAAREEAEALLCRAREAAEDILAGAEEAVARQVAEAAEATAATVREEQEAVFAREIADFVQRFEDAQELALKEIAHEMTSLVAEIAEKVVYAAVAVDPEATLRAVREALGELGAGGRVRVCVPEEDEAAVSEQRAALFGVLRETAEIQIVPDARLHRGGCVVQTDKGEVDARLETRLASVREEIERVG